MKTEIGIMQKKSERYVHVELDTAELLACAGIRLGELEAQMDSVGWRIGHDFGAVAGWCVRAASL